VRVAYCDQSPIVFLSAHFKHVLQSQHLVEISWLIHSALAVCVALTLSKLYLARGNVFPSKTIALMIKVLYTCFGINPLILSVSLITVILFPTHLLSYL